MRVICHLNLLLDLSRQSTGKPCKLSLMCWRPTLNAGIWFLNSRYKVISSTWTLKVKRYPNGTVKKFKAWFCAHSDQQKKGIIFLRHGLQLCNGPQFGLWWFSQHWKVGNQFSVTSQRHSFMCYSSQEKKYMSINCAVSKLKTIMFSSCVVVSMVSVKPHATFLSTSQNILFVKGLHLWSMIRACSLALLWLWLSTLTIFQSIVRTKMKVMILSIRCSPNGCPA